VVLTDQTFSTVSSIPKSPRKRELEGRKSYQPLNREHTRTGFKAHLESIWREEQDHIRLLCTA